jgi:hypothetical protein
MGGTLSPPPPGGKGKIRASSRPEDETRTGFNRKIGKRRKESLVFMIFPQIDVVSFGRA